MVKSVRIILIINCITIEYNFACFLDVWIYSNLNQNRTFIKQQCKDIMKLSSQKLRTKMITYSQLIYIFNIVLILKLIYLIQIISFTIKEYLFFISPLFTNIKHKLSLSCLVDVCIFTYLSFYKIQDLHNQIL